MQAKYLIFFFITKNKSHDILYNNVYPRLFTKLHYSPIYVCMAFHIRNADISENHTVTSPQYFIKKTTCHCMACNNRTDTHLNTHYKLKEQKAPKKLPMLMSFSHLQIFVTCFQTHSSLCDLLADTQLRRIGVSYRH